MQNYGMNGKHMEKNNEIKAQSDWRLATVDSHLWIATPKPYLREI